VIESLPRLLRIGMDLIDRDVRQLRGPGASDQHLEPSPETAP